MAPPPPVTTSKAGALAVELLTPARADTVFDQVLRGAFLPELVEVMGDVVPPAGPIHTAASRQAFVRRLRALLDDERCIAIRLTGRRLDYRPGDAWRRCASDSGPVG